MLSNCIASLDRNKTLDLIKKRAQERNTEERYYISSLNADSKRLGKIIQSHWEIENKHY